MTLFKKHVSTFLVFALLSVSSFSPAADEAAPTWKTRAQAALKNSTCRKTIAAIGSVVALSLASWGYYNWDRAQGPFQNLGTQAEPIWSPDVKEILIVDERITHLNIPRERTLKVHDGSKSFGDVVFHDDKIIYKRGKDIVAETCIVSPYGRPYDSEIPIRVTILDTQGNLIGAIEEHSETLANGNHRIHFRVTDSKFREVGVTESFEETSQSQRVSSPWTVNFSDARTVLTRKEGHFADRYTWKEGGAEREIDARIEVIFAALKSYVEAFRK